MEHSSICKECGHLMAEHGVEVIFFDDGVGTGSTNKGYCARGPDLSVQ